jgi:hypothetical protein
VSVGGRIWCERSRAPGNSHRQSLLTAAPLTQRTGTDSLRTSSQTCSFTAIAARDFCGKVKKSIHNYLLREGDFLASVIHIDHSAYERCRGASDFLYKIICLKHTQPGRFIHFNEWLAAASLDGNSIAM